ncbi:MAG: complex I subunit 4 family protein [Candidatus Micrarchaeia archaeon]
MLLIPLAGIALVIMTRRWGSEIAIIVAALEFIFFLIASVAFIHIGNVNESYVLMPAINVNLDLGMNNISFIFMFLTVVVFLAASIASRFFVEEERLGYNLLIMLGEAGSIGLFLSGNLFVLYLFWDLSIIVMFFMLFHFGSYDRRYASIKFIIYSIFSSSLLLIGIILIYFNLPTHSFSINQLLNMGYLIPKNTQILIFALLLTAFMVKMPVFPFHSWAPDAYSESNSGGAILLSGVLSKFGVYGLIILFISLPIAKEYSIYVGILFALSSIYGAATAMSQKNLKRMLSYLSISEIGILGFAVATMNVLGMSAALFGSLSHALVISLLFLIVFGIEKVFGTPTIDRLGGITKESWFIGYLFLFGILATIGLPLTSGFISDLLMFLGGVKSFGIIIMLPAIALIINAAYLFWTYERVFLIGNEAERYDILDNSVIASFVLLAAFIIVIGIFPQIVLNGIGAIL